MRRRRLPFDPNLPETAENQVSTLLTLFPYLWPKDRPDLRTKVVGAMIFITGAKVLNTLDPIIWGLAVDRVASGDLGLLAIAIALVIGYGITKVLVALFGELRAWLFVSVGQNAIRQVALKTFTHLHSLAMRFHLDRQTGGLSRVIERGTRGIQFVLNFSLFNIIPTLFEITLVTIILFVYFGIWYALIALLSVGIYIFFTLVKILCCS